MEGSMKLSYDDWYYGRYKEVIWFEAVLPDDAIKVRFGKSWPPDLCPDPILIKHVSVIPTNRSRPNE